MELYSSNDSYKLYKGDMRNMLDVIKKESIDVVLTDPPYELNFMGKGWDNSGIAFQPSTWQKCYEVLKPGGYLLAFGGSRTFHRIACAIEDAGFEIRDTIMWLYGSGFPKSMNIGLALDKKNGVESKIVGTQTVPDIRGDAFGTMNEKQGGSYKNITRDIKEATNEWNGWGTALKPSFEPIIVARKPFKGSLVDNVIEYGVGGINIDECRVGNEERFNPSATIGKDGIYNWNTTTNENEDYNGQVVNGRFPANTILTYDETDFDEVCGGFPYNKSSLGPAYYKGNYTKNGWKNTSKQNTSEVMYNDSGSASRYFMNCKYTGKDEETRRYIYTPKASKKDRDEGLDEFETKTKVFNGKSNESSKEMKDVEERFTTLEKNTHPTVKPTNLMQYLIRLVSPDGATILDPFNGSGSTGKAVMYENKEKNKNYKYIGIELTEEYLPIAKARIEYVCNKKEIKEKEQIKKGKEENQLTIFDMLGDDINE